MKAATARFADSRGPHEHQRCMERALRVAQELCHERGLSLTPIRRRVLELVWRRHAPIGAYDILEQLNREDKPTAPPTVYRALAFLLEAGLIHRIDTLNAYLACETPRQTHAAQFLVCRSCRQVREFGDPAIVKLLARRVKSAGFKADVHDLEIKGLCSSCREVSEPASR
ncbi:MAG TPA: Fur family transcriptional regulator [Steroidobacteraceae bacterium]|nr:Fur family transcriptional regulator [Steroidobacteraceae bacterium]